QFFQQTPEMKEEVKSRLKRMLKESVLEKTKLYIAEQVYHNVEGLQSVQEFEKLTREMNVFLDTSLEEVLDARLGSVYDHTLDALRNIFSSQQNLQFIDPSNLRASLDRVLSEDTLFHMLSSNISNIFGQSTAKAIEKHLSDLLQGKVPSEFLHVISQGQQHFETYLQELQENLPGNKYQELKNSILSKPLLTLPSPAYAGVLAARAALHFSKAYKGIFVDPYEIKRGIEVTRVMIWQLKNKKNVHINLFELAGLAEGFAHDLGMAVEFEHFQETIFSPLQKLEAALSQIDENVLTSLSSVQAEVLSKIKPHVEEVQASLTHIRETLLQPVHNLQNSFADSAEKLKQSIDPAFNVFNGLPSDWNDAKKKINGVVPKDLLSLKPRMALQALEEKLGISALREDLKKKALHIEESIVENLAQVSANTLEYLHLLSPSLKLLPKENLATFSSSSSSLLTKNNEFFLSHLDVKTSDLLIFTTLYQASPSSGSLWTHNQKIFPNTKELSYFYNKQEMLVKVKENKGESLYLSYSDDGSLQHVFDTKGHEARYEYDDRKNLIGVYDEKNNLKAFYRYDKNDLPQTDNMLCFEDEKNKSLGLLLRNKFGKIQKIKRINITK
ncbi:MAG: hypothetical protein COX62_04520, partial [Deltaproteobacteria bacterium CG_4_10_14_0_2_um_filter_43_8]